MSAPYPLVRNVSAFSTRFGVFTSPSRSGSSPSCARRFLTRSCIRLLYIPLICTLLMTHLAAAQSPDALYSDRDNLTSARKAADLWAAASQHDPSAYEPAWKLARVCYWLGAHAPEAERRGYLEKGIAAAQQAARLEPGRPEGHFWLAADMGALAEKFGVRAGLKYRKPIREELET